jgi:hypothetical protein
MKMKKDIKESNGYSNVDSDIIEHECRVIWAG